MRIAGHPACADTVRTCGEPRLLFTLLVILLVASARADATDAQPPPEAAPAPAPMDARQERLLCGFASAAESAIFDQKGARLSDEHALPGGRCLRVESGGYLSSWRLPQDWSAWDTLELDAFVDSGSPLQASLLVADDAWRQHGSSYWDRHNRDLTLRPGANIIRLPVHGLWRGEAGSRGNGLKTPIDCAHIIRFDIGFSGGTAGAAVYLRSLRLTRSAHPDGLLAFAFGPPESSGGEGFIPITWNTVHGAGGAAYGLERACVNPNRARSDIFPTRLYQSYLWFEEDGNAFIADVSNGLWHAWVMFDDCGYWGGEQARFERRTILANGAIADVEERPLGAADYLYRFEQVEPLPGASLWDLYVAPLFTPRRVTVQVDDGRLRLQMRAQSPWSTKVAAIVLYPDRQRAAAERWLRALEAANRAEFEARAVCTDPPRALQPPASALEQGWWRGYPALADDVRADGPPGPDQGQLGREGVPGQPLAFAIAVRALRDFGEARLSISDLTGPGGAIPASACELRYAQYQARRGASDIAYTIAAGPLPLVASAHPYLAANCTRAFWIIATIPPGTKPGSYAGTLTIAAGALLDRETVRIQVLPFTLATPAYPLGFLGAWVPDELPAHGRADAWSDLATRMVRAGMTSMSGGPGIQLRGFTSAGAPELDFGACDAYFANLARAGMPGALYGYGGPANIEGLCDGGTIGETGKHWCVALGVDFPAVVARVVAAVEAHAKARGWPRVYRCCFDEPRTPQGARANVEFARAWATGAPQDLLGGFFSVNWAGHDPFDAAMQELFATVAWSGLNGHSQVDLDRARSLGREVHIYNQGLDRYSFGLYQWAECQKGVRGRMQWNVLALHGWQFFDLDGREPDTGVINWGRSEIIPTLDLIHCAEGAWDFRYAWNLWARAQAHPELPAARRAIDYLAGISAGIPAGARERPAGAPSDEEFRAGCSKLLAALPAG